MFARVWNTLLTIAVVLAALLAIAFAGVRVVGLTPYAVLTGSMEPRFPVGSLVYVHACDPATIEVGDAVAFELSSGTLVTHEVYEVDAEAQQVRTRGIANKDEQGNISPDAAPVAWSQVKGVAVGCVPLLGYVNSFVTQAPGIYLTIVAVAVMALVSILVELNQRAAHPRGAHAATPQHRR